MEKMRFSIPATGTYYLELVPLSEKANNRNFFIKARCTGSLDLKIMGYDLEQFLSLIGIIVILSFLYGYYRLFKVSVVHSSPEQKAVLRAAGYNVPEDAEPGNNSNEQSSEKEKELFCAECGASRENEADFCGKCGNKFS